MRARVLWVVKGLGPGGAEMLLASAAEVHDRARFQIECAFVVSGKDQLVDRLAGAGVVAHCLSTRERDVLWPARLWQLVRSGTYQVIHVHSPLPGSIARLAALSMGRARPRLVTTEHNAWSTYSSPTRILNAATSRLDDATFTVSDEVRTSLRGRAARLSRTLVHGIDIASVRALGAARETTRAELGLGSTEFVIGTVANFREQKDYPTLLRAIRTFLDAGGVARWLLVGQGPLEADVRRLAKQLGLEECVHFTGYRSDAARVQSTFDVFTLASKWEGLPVALMEACALGTPIVSTRVGGVAEVIQHDVSGLLVPSGDAKALAAAWRRVQTDEALRERLARSSRTLASGFDVIKSQATQEATYLSLFRQRDARWRDQLERKRSVGGSGADLLIRPIADEDEGDVLRLLSRSLGWSDDPRFGRLYRWKHHESVFGPSWGWLAVDGDRVVAVRLFMRWTFTRGGEQVHAVRAVDTATDPEYQGRGLFRALTLHGLIELERAGVGFVFNTPNEFSLPGYRSMGWNDAGHVRIGVRPVGIHGAVRATLARRPAELWPIPMTVGDDVETWLGKHTNFAQRPDPSALSTELSRDFVRWRFGLPELGYRVVEAEDASAVVRLRARGRARELAFLSALTGSARAVRRLVRSVAVEAGATHIVAVGDLGYRQGFVPLRGPILATRKVALDPIDLVASWQPNLGEIELF